MVCAPSEPEKARKGSADANLFGVKETATGRICDEERIAERVRAGDPTLITDLFNCYGDDLTAFLRHRCGNTADAEDALQDAFLAATRYLDDFRGDSAVRSWLYRLAGSACTKMRRGKKRDASAHRRLDDGILAVTPGGEVTRDVQGALQAVESMLEARLSPLRSALEGLTETDRAVLMMRDAHGMTAKEVGSTLGLTEGAVKSRLHRARKTVGDIVGHP